MADMKEADCSAERKGFDTLVSRTIHFCLHNRFVVFSLFIGFLLAGVYFSPFDWDVFGIDRNPVPVDAIPDIGENQQIVFTEWPGRSPQDIENQVSYPLTVSLMGLPGVKTVRSLSMFGFSTIYVIFDEGREFYWTRTRILEKLNSLPPDMLPEGVKPALGPDATALGQVFWYTLEGQDSKGSPTGGWDLDELRSIQDWNVRYALLSVPGVSEVASVGGFVKEYQVDVNPDALRVYNVSLEEVYDAVRRSNIDVGARTIEVNGVEYIIRGLGYVKSLSDIGDSVVKAKDGVPIYVKNVATVSAGPEQRRGILDKGGAEAVGGVVVVRFGENPLKVIKDVKREISHISGSLPKRTLADGTVSQVKIVPFYDRTGLIYETLGTLDEAIIQEMLVVTIVIILMIRQFRVAAMMSMLLPAAVLCAFVLMRLFHVDANVVALSGIAIAIGTIDDLGIIICENIVKHLAEAKPGESRINVVYRGASEVGSAVVTSVSTTIVSFLPVFSLQGAEGKLFTPLAYTKTFTIGLSVVIAITIMPPLAYLLLGKDWLKGSLRVAELAFFGALAALAGWAAWHFDWTFGWALMAFPLYWSCRRWVPERVDKALLHSGYIIAAAIISWYLTADWMPLGPEAGMIRNFAFVAIPIGAFLLGFVLIERYYGQVLGLCLRFKAVFLLIPLLMVLAGFMAWRGFEPVEKLVPEPLRGSWCGWLKKEFPGVGSEFMPALDEGSFLFMPTLMPHASVAEVQDVLRKQDLGIEGIPEVEGAVGKAGRVESAIDPAPLFMIETVINYRSKYLSDKDGRPLSFKHDPEATDFFRDASGKTLPASDGQPYIVRGKFVRDAEGRLIPDSKGAVFRQWRPPLDPALNPGRAEFAGVDSPDDIWGEIVKAADVPGSTSAPKLQPIQTRIVMLQSGMRASMGVIVRAPDLAALERAVRAIEVALKTAPSVQPETVIPDRVVGKPYLEFSIDREAIARYGVKLADVQDVIETALGGKAATTTVEGRERYSIRVRYQRELRDSVESLGKILVATASGTPVPLSQLSKIVYRRGPESVKGENSFLIGYVFFDKKPGYAETDAVELASAHLRKALDKGGKSLLPEGVSYRFGGNYENQLRANRRLMVIVPVALALVFILLYLQFKTFLTCCFIYSQIVVAWAGGFIMIWLYGQPWFLDFSVFGYAIRDIYQVHPINLSVAVWVGFLALFGIATDDGVVMGSYISEVFRKRRPQSIKEVREMIVAAGKRRIRPCLMTTATTVLALIPVLTATGRGADIAIPMAIPVFGGMAFEVISMLIVPVLYCALEEFKFMAKEGALLRGYALLPGKLFRRSRP